MVRHARGPSAAIVWVPNGRTERKISSLEDGSKELPTIQMRRAILEGD